MKLLILSFRFTTVLWIDAHADLNIPDHSPSGNMHGMPVGLLLKEMQYDLASISGLEWLELEPDARLSADSIGENVLTLYSKKLIN